MKPPPHTWGEPVRFDERLLVKTCFTCGLQVRFVQAGDAETAREVYIEGTWQRVRKNPPCKRVKKGVRAPRVLTEAQRMVFQVPVRKSEP